MLKVTIALLLGAAEALQAPCYGYGEIMGEPDKYLADDLDLVTELEIGKGDTYVANVNYLFEGKNFLQIGYKKYSDEDFREFSYPHGGPDVEAKRFNLLDHDSRLLNLGWVHNQTKDSMLAFIFVEYFRTGYSPKPWVLTAFNPRKIPYYEFVDEVPGILKQVETFTWSVQSQVGQCSMLGDVPKTELVGFTTTKRTIEDTQLQSLQPIYYSGDQNICDCLGENPTMSRDTTRMQAKLNENFFDRLAREGKLETFVNLVTSFIAILVIVSILVCVLCYAARKQPVKRQMSFNAEVYTDLAVRAEQRVYLMEQAIAHVKKHGYQKKQVKTTPFSFGMLEAGQVAGSMLQSIDALVPQKRKSNRQRKGGDDTTGGLSSNNEQSISQKPLSQFEQVEDM